MTILAFQPHDSQAKLHHDCKCKCNPDSTSASAASMARSSPLRRTQLPSTPDRAIRSSFLLDDRNTETSHLDALAAAQAEHDRVREAAIRVYELHELREEHQRILDQERREQERLKAEAELAAEEKRLQELKAKSIPKPPPPAAPEAPKTISEALAADNPKEAKRPSAAAPANPGLKPQVPSQNGIPATQAKPAVSFPPHPQIRQQPGSQEAVAQRSIAPSPKATVIPSVPSTAPAKATSQTAMAKPAVDRFVQIHGELKTLRKDMMALSKAPGSPLKGKVGTYRREIRVAIGQLTSGKGANVQPVRLVSIFPHRVLLLTASRPIGSWPS